MLETSLRFVKSNGDDRFYDATKARQDHSVRRQNSVSALPEKTSGPDESPKAALATAYSSSNLGRFLDSTTPWVPAQYFSKMMTRGWRSCDEEHHRPYFLLADLWESFKEWSAYGAGVPLVLGGSDCFVQYYVPYLSGIQLYGHSSSGPDSSRPLWEDSDGDCYRDSSSDGSSDSELDRGLKYARDWNLNHLGNTSTLGMDRLSLRENHVAFQEGFSSDDSDCGSSQDRLLFQYLERDPPYSREPLADKISDLARSFPELKTSRSCDLLPASWVSVAWYPIYRIPTGATLKDLDACFLTFHSISTPVTGPHTAACPTVAYPHGSDSVPKISLRSFGLASYKLKGSLWTPSVGCESQLTSSLLQAADNWLRVLNVDHPDYRFFTSHGSFRR